MTKKTTPATTRKDAKAKRARQLFRHAPSKPLRDDISSGRKPYPADLMPLSRRKTLDAAPLTRDNYNPVGERGEHRHTPPQCRDEEDRIDGMTPKEAEEAAEFWPSSIGSCFDARGM